MISGWLHERWHRIQHYFGWNVGCVVHFERDGVECVAFMCNGCGKLAGIQPSRQFYLFHD